MDNCLKLINYYYKWQVIGTYRISPIEDFGEQWYTEQHNDNVSGTQVSPEVAEVRSVPLENVRRV